MDTYAPSNYFDLAKFEHAALFDDNEPVWNVLKKLGDYLLSGSLGNILGTVEQGAHLVKLDEIYIGKGSVVEPGAYILGPCIIGENCQIRQGAYIRGNVILGNNCIIGHATEVKNSLFLDGAQAGHFAYVGDSILGNNVNLGAGTKCANLRFDRQNILVQQVETGLKKFGAIVGDGAQTGCNSVTNPGTMMGKESCLAPCAAAKGVIPKNYVVKGPENVMMAHHS